MAKSTRKKNLKQKDTEYKSPYSKGIRGNVLTVLEVELTKEVDLEGIFAREKSKLSEAERRFVENAEERAEEIRIMESERLREDHCWSCGAKMELVSDVPQQGPEYRCISPGCMGGSSFELV